MGCCCGWASGGVREKQYRSFGCHHAPKEDANPELLQIDPKANGGLKEKKEK